MTRGPAGAVVTGGSGGIGRAIVAHPTATGSDVVLTYHQNRAGADSIIEAVSARGGHAHAYPLDVTRPGDIEKLLRTAVDVLPSIDLLVNTAAVGSGGSCHRE